jgi:AcrR family transcriptional regulator
VAHFSLKKKVQKKRSDRVATEKKLIDTAIKLFSKAGYESTSVHTIANQSGINVSLISRYFGDKGGLLNALAEDAFAEIQERVHDYPPQENLFDELSEYAKAEFKAFLIDQELTTILIQQSITNKDFRKKLKNLFDKNQLDPFLLKRLQRLKSSGKIDKKVKLEDLQLGIGFQFFSQFILGKLILNLQDDEILDLIALYVTMICERVSID